jgi:Tfp pilus assembly protein FimT
VVVTNTNAQARDTKTAKTESSLVTITVSAPANAAAPIIEKVTVTKDAQGRPVLTVTATSPDGGELSYEWWRGQTVTSGDRDVVASENDRGIGYQTASFTVLYPTNTEIRYYWVIVTNTNNNATNNKTATANSNPRIEANSTTVTVGTYPQQ